MRFGPRIFPTLSTKAERLGVSLAACLLLCASALAFLPVEPPPEADAMPVARLHAENPSAFLDMAPFDPLHDRRTSFGPLDGPPPPSSEPLVIGGIMINGPERKVMFAARPDAWLDEGTEVDGWLIRHIEPETVILTRGADILSPTLRSAFESAARQRSGP